MFRAAFLAERAAHEAAAIFSPRKDDFSQYRFVQLNQSRTARQEIANLFTKDLNNVRCQLLASNVGLVANAFHPHDAGEEVRSRQRDFHRLVGERSDKLLLVRGDGPSSLQLAEHRWMANFAGGHIQ